MKKWTFLVAALLSSATLCTTSCVDDNESASVTNIRDAKAEQLKALATLSKAQAEAALIQANAEKAVKEAEAAYKQAMAEALKLDNQLQEMEVQKAQAGLEQALEAAKLQAEAALLQAKAELEDAKVTLINALDKADNAEKQRIQELVSKADNVLYHLKNYRHQKINQQSTIARLKAELVGTEEYVAEQIRSYEKQIAEQEAYIAEYEKYIAEGASTSKEEAYKAWKEVQATLNPLWDEYQKLFNESGKADNEFNAISDKSGDHVFIVKARENNWLRFYKRVNIFDEKKNYGLWMHTFNHTFKDGTIGTWTWYNLIENYVVDEDKIAREKETAKDRAEYAQNQIVYWTSEQKIATLAVADAKKAFETLKASDEYKAAEKAVADAQKAYDEAKTAEEAQTAKNDLDNAKYQLLLLTESAETNIKNAEARLESAEVNIKEYNEKLTLANEINADAEAAVKFLEGEEAKAYAAYVEEYKKALTAKAEAMFIAEEAEDIYNFQANIAASLQSIYNNQNDYVSLISGCKQNIAQQQAAIANLNDVETKEEAIKQAEETLAKIEKSISIYEKQYADYMAKIESLIKEEAPETKA